MLPVDGPRIAPTEPSCCFAWSRRVTGSSLIRMWPLFALPERQSPVPVVLDRASAVLDQLDVAAQHLPEDAPRRLALLRAQTNLELPDCCVLLAAEQTDAAVATFDHRLANAATERGLVARER
jgi:predicted nucleic acid-binding protein